MDAVTLQEIADFKGHRVWQYMVEKLLARRQLNLSDCVKLEGNALFRAQGAVMEDSFLLSLPDTCIEVMKNKGGIPNATK